MKQKLKTVTVKAGKSQATRLSPFENYVHLGAMVRLHIRGRTVGAYLLQKSKASFCIVFGFRCRGVHTTLRDEQMDPVFDAIESGLGDLLPGESLTIHLSSFSSDSERQAQLRKLVEQAPSSELQFLLLAEQARIRELTQQGVRKPKELYLYVTYTVDSELEGNDWVEKFLCWASNNWQKFTGEFAEKERQRLDQMLTKAATEGCFVWERLLANRMGLDVQALDDQQLWANLWHRINSTEPKPVPQLLILDGKNGLSEAVSSDLHGTSVLLESMPEAERSYVKVRDNYVGVLTFLDKPGGWASKWSQLRYLWEIVARDTVAETEIFCQLSRANPKLVQSTVQLLLKQSNTAADVAEKNRSIDVAAQLKVKKAVKAQEEIFEGAVPVYCSVVILVHRPNLVALDEACRTLESYFKRPAWVAREEEYAWRIWLQTLPICWERMLNVPFDRRQLYLTNEAPGLMPLVVTNAGDKSGFELIAEEGGTPIHLDLFKAHKNLGIFATTRAGKSVLVSGILTQALSHKMPVVALDFPKPDGTSTFTDYTNFIGGAYFDIARESNNLFELPDLRHLPPTEQQERFQDYQSFLESALLTMIVGDAEDKMLTQTVRSLIVLALNAFFRDPNIASRYEVALASGYGSPLWEKMPTMADFLPYCSQEHLDLNSVEGDTHKGLERIGLRLRFWLTSRVGRAISMPSSFPTDAQLLVFALRNLSDEEDAAVLALSAYSAALRRALASPASIFFIDEAPILFEFNTISSLVGRLCANGAKSGVRVILSGQDPDTIARSPSASKIFQNLTTRLIGRIQPTAVDSFVSILKYPRSIIGRNATESFFPKREGLYSQWLLDDVGCYTFCRYYPSEVQLAVVANNPDEQTARTQAMRAHADKFQGLAHFSRQYATAIRQGKPLTLSAGKSS